MLRFTLRFELLILLLTLRFDVLTLTPVLGRARFCGRDEAVALELVGRCEGDGRDCIDALRLEAERVMEPECLILPRLRPLRAHTRVLPISSIESPTMMRRLLSIIFRFVLVFIIYLHFRSGQKFHLI